jgi:hypothetical protein
VDGNYILDYWLPEDLRRQDSCATAARACDHAVECCLFCFASPGTEPAGAAHVDVF